MAYKVAEVLSVTGTIKYTPVFNCANCGSRAIGDTGYIEVEGVSVDTLTNIVSNVNISRYQMPVGWTSHTVAVYCPKCQVNHNNTRIQPRT